MLIPVLEHELDLTFIHLYYIVLIIASTSSTVIPPFITVKTEEKWTSKRAGAAWWLGTDVITAP